MAVIWHIREAVSATQAAKEMKDLDRNSNWLKKIKKAERIWSLEMKQRKLPAAAAAVSDCIISKSTMSPSARAESSSDAVPESRSSTYGDVTSGHVT